MKVKKYPQSHLVITNDSGSKLVIDLGDLTFERGFKVEEFADVNGILITHNHYDHLPEKYIEELKRIASGKQIFGNADVVAKLKEVGIEGIEVKDRQKLKVADFEIEAFDLPHFPHPLGKEMPPNTGFVINGLLFHPGDGYELEGLNVDNAALPIGHPFLSTIMVLNFAKSLQAKVVIPIHYDAYPRDPEELVKFAKELGIEVRPLAPGEETEIS